MQLSSKKVLFQKNQIAYLSGLSLLFAYAELLIPRVVPFFRLGLSNISLLLGFSLSLPSYLCLAVVKALCSSLTSGTLFTPFVLISIGQSVASGFVMYVLKKSIGKIKEGRLISLYGISMAGSAVSSVLQIALSSIYLGSGTYSLLAPMLLFSLLSAFVTAFLANCICRSPEELQELENTMGTDPEILLSSLQVPQKNRNKIPSFLLVILILIFVVGMFLVQNVWILLATMIVSLVIQKISGRRILVLPFIGMWAFVIISCLIIPHGKILFEIGKFSVTDGALMEGIVKSIRLTGVMAISQAATKIKITNTKSFLFKIFAYNKFFQQKFNASEGSISERIKKSMK